MTGFKHILVATDFGESSGRALDVAVDLAKKYDASLTILHVCEVPVYPYEGMISAAVDLLTPVQEAARKTLDATLVEVRERVPNAKGVLALGVTWQEILRAIGMEHADLLVMGTHGRRGLGHVLLGSVAEKTVRASPVPVLTIRGAAGEPGPGLSG